MNRNVIKMLILSISLFTNNSFSCCSNDEKIETLKFEIKALELELSKFEESLNSFVIDITSLLIRESFEKQYKELREDLKLRNQHINLWLKQFSEIKSNSFVAKYSVDNQLPDILNRFIQSYDPNTKQVRLCDSVIVRCEDQTDRIAIQLKKHFFDVVIISKDKRFAEFEIEIRQKAETMRRLRNSYCTIL